jgi:hypothetical protein
MRVFYAAQRARSTHWRGPAIFLPTRLALQAASTSKDCSTGSRSASLKASSPESWPSGRCGIPAALLPWRQFLHHLIQIEARGLLPGREFLEARQPLCDHRLRRHDEEGAVRHPFAVFE